MERFLFTIVLMFVTLLQSTFFPAMELLNIIPDFALVLLLVWSASRGMEEGLLWAFGLGLWMDFLTLDPLGTHVIPLLAVALIGGAVRGKLFRSGAVLPVVAVAGATIVYRVIGVLIQTFSGQGVEVTGEARLAILAALLNALLVPLVYGFLLMMDRWLPRRVS